MRQAWIDNYVVNDFNEQIAEILGDDDFNVELFGVGFYDKKLPKNFSIVDYGSRETLAFIRDGEVIDDPDEIRAIEDAECC